MITVNTDKFRATLRLALRTVMGKPTMPILGCVLLEADKEAQRVRISGTNLDTTISTSCPAVIAEDWALCVSGAMMGRVADSVAGADIVLRKVRTQIELKSAASTFKVHGIDKAEWPAAPATVVGDSMSFAQAALASQLEAVSDAQSDDETRYILNGVYINATKDGVTFVATDGRRLHLIRQKTEGAITGSLILPAHGVSTLTSLLKSGANATLTLEAKRVYVVIDREDGAIHFTSKVVEGNYPNYRQVIPKVEQSVNVARAQLSEAVHRVALASSEKSSSIRLSVEGEVLTLSSSSPDFGESTEVLEISNTTKVKGMLAVNPRFLISALDAVEADIVTLGWASGDISINALSVKAGEFDAVVMPVRLS